MNLVNNTYLVLNEFGYEYLGGVRNDLSNYNSVIEIIF